MIDLSTLKKGDTVKFRCGGEYLLKHELIKNHELTVIRFGGLSINYKKNGDVYGENENHIFDIIEIIPTPFDWDNVEQGMAFRGFDDNSIVWYAASFYTKEDSHVIVFRGLNEDGTLALPRGAFKSYLTRVPENDIEVKS